MRYDSVYFSFTIFFLPSRKVNFSFFFYYHFFAIEAYNTLEQAAHVLLVPKFISVFFLLYIYSLSIGVLFQQFTFLFIGFVNNFVQLM